MAIVNRSGLMVEGKLHSNTQATVQGDAVLLDSSNKIPASLLPSGGSVTSITAGTGLTGGTITTSGTIAHATSGVTADTYQSVTVNAYGHVTAGSNPFASTIIYDIEEVD